jgi:hypothetical protein
MAHLADHPLMTQLILVALGNFKPRPDMWVETLLDALNSPVAAVRETAVSLPGKQVAEADVKMWTTPVWRVVNDREKGVRDDAIGALKSARGLAISATGALVQVLRTDTDAEVRGWAAEAIGEIADASFAIDTVTKTAAAKEALPVLVAALDSDANRDVREKALRSIDKLQIDIATAAGILARAAVQQTDRKLRLAALQMLRNRGKEAASARTAITPLKKDADELIRRSTDAALEAMTSASYSARTVSAAPVDPVGRSPNGADDRGNTPLMQAVEDCDVEIIKILLAAKADINAQNASGITPFEFG